MGNGMDCVRLPSRNRCIYVSHMMDKKVEERAPGAARAKDLLKDEPQALFAVLRLSLQQQFSYWISLVHPSQVAAAADRVDTILLRVLETIGGFLRVATGHTPAQWDLKLDGWRAGLTSR